MIHRIDHKSCKFSPLKQLAPIELVQVGFVVFTTFREEPIFTTGAV